MASEAKMDTCILTRFWIPLLTRLILAVYLLAAVMGTLFVITAIMVCSPISSANRFQTNSNHSLVQRICSAPDSTSQSESSQRASSSSHPMQRTPLQRSEITTTASCSISSCVLVFIFQSCTICMIVQYSASSSRWEKVIPQAVFAWSD